MKRILIFWFIVCCFLQQAAAQGLRIDSTRFITGVNPYTEIRFSIPTSDKGILFVGSASYNAGGIIPYFPYGNANVLVGKIDSNQKISWVKQFGGSDDDIAFSACETPDGGYAVLAHTSSNNGDITGYKGGSDIWLLRLDDTGNLLWEKTYGSSGDDQPISVALTPDNGFILLGVSNGSDDDVPFHYGSIWSFDWLVIKTDSAGTVQWSKDMGGTGDEGGGTILSVDSFYYLTGISNSSDHDCIDTAWHAGVNTSFDYHLLKLDNSGRILWDSSYGGTGSEGLSYAMFDKRDSAILMIGKTNSVDYMVTGFKGNRDAWVVKINKKGTLLWGKTFGTINEEYGTGICKGPNGGYLAYCGTYFGPIGATDAWLFLLDSSGNEITNKIFGGIEHESPASVFPYLNGYVVTGTSGSSVFTEGTSNINYSGAFVSYLNYWPVSVQAINKTKSQLLIYPNPAIRSVRITIPTGETGKLIFESSVGQLVDKIDIRSPVEYAEINSADWGCGLYIVKWQGEDGTMLTTKFIKN